MFEKESGMGNKEEKTCFKRLGLMGFGAGSNASMVDVCDGKIIRTRPLHYDLKYRPEDFRPWELKARGKVFKPTTKSLLPPLSLAYKKRVYSPNRILYPLKRVDWDPDGNRHPEGRGTSGFVRISWDEAIDIITREIKRIHKEYDPYAILCQADGHGEEMTVHGPHGCNTMLLQLMGGYTLQVRNPDSWEGWYWGGKHAWGFEGHGKAPQTNNMLDVSKNTDLLLFWGCDPETTPWGWGGQMASRLCYWFTELGIKTIYICPDLNYGAAIHADKWIPIKPNTDAALHLAIAYVWITEGTYDKEYVATHTFGFGKFEEYVLGKEDGIPKTPKWAAEITGVPSRIIKALAREWSSKRTSIAHGNGGSYIRSAYATEPARLEILNLAMQGVGKPGVQQLSMIEWAGGIFGNPMPRGTITPDTHAAYHGHSLKYGFPKQFIPKTMIPDAILNPPLTFHGKGHMSSPLEDQFVKYTYPVDGCSEIHMIWTDTPCWTACWNGGHRMMEALQSPKIEFILAQHPWLENDCLFADIILPSNTKFEQEDIGVDVMSGQYNTIFHEEQCVESVGESKSNYEIVAMIAKRLGFLDAYTEGKSVKEWIRYGFDNSGVQNVISWEEFRKTGYYVVPTDTGWENLRSGMTDFYENPEKNPLKTPSGKIEFYSQNLGKHFPDDDERPPVPHWIPYGESHQESLLHERAKKYPLLIVSNHPRWRVHVNLDDVSWLREISSCKVKGPDGYMYEPVWINPMDASARGIHNGDVVEVFNERGGILGGAYLTERIMPGVISMDHGARVDQIITGKLDRGGSNNLIAPHKTTSRNVGGQVTSGFLVEVRLADLDEMKRRYPEAFERQYDPATGLSLGAWVKGANG
jgi:molybdopterin guanine dinucleotide-containing S/N-oxide reductase-like protein